MMRTMFGGGPFSGWAQTAEENRAPTRRSAATVAPSAIRGDVERVEVEGGHASPVPGTARPGP